MKDVVEYGDFAKLDIRVGLIVAASNPEWSEKLIRYEIDFGEEIGKRILFSGIRKWYSPDELVGRKVPVIINLAPKKMGEEYSQGMVIMADTEEKPILIFVDDSVAVGSVVR